MGPPNRYGSTGPGNCYFSVCYGSYDFTWNKVMAPYSQLEKYCLSPYIYSWPCIHGEQILLWSRILSSSSREKFPDGPVPIANFSLKKHLVPYKIYNIMLHRTAFHPASFNPIPHGGGAKLPTQSHFFTLKTNKKRWDANFFWLFLKFTYAFVCQFWRS